jgi:hypothetical protein
MSNPNDVSRIDAALSSSDPEASLVALVRDLQKEGLVQSEIYDLFETQLLRHRDSNESFYDALANTMDRIVGWCSPHLRLFDSYLRQR